jgi:hypothetical protein
VSDRRYRSEQVAPIGKIDWPIQEAIVITIASEPESSNVRWGNSIQYPEISRNGNVVETVPIISQVYPEFR